MHRDRTDGDKKDAATAMGAPSFLFALANLVVVAVKLFKPNKMPSMIGCGLCFLGMIFTLASCLLRDVRRREEDISKALDAGSSYGLGFGSSVTCFSSSCSSLSSWLGVICTTP